MNRDGTTVGLLTYKMLVGHLLGKVPEDEFERDDDVLAVSKRAR